ncbi:GDP-L-fucose synthase [Litorivicinus sp.]|nr:GDP-L-fucose synthase [Litorivicinus sp.]MDC1239972.1 GDP-L-fucose synthase [Litorivicinus sp.]
MNNESLKIYVAGHNGMVGSAIIRELEFGGFTGVITRSSAELDLTNQNAVREFFASEKPHMVYIAAAKVGGIHANDTYPAEFIYQNLMIEANVIDAAYRVGVERMIFLGSSCIYPKFASQPIQESALLSGYLESTNEPYAIAKIAGIKLCESYNRQYGTDFRSIMPSNLYGPGDTYHIENSHVIPSLIRRFHEAKVNGFDSVTVWGTGKVRREFLYVDDLACACIHLMGIDRNIFWKNANHMCSHINAGAGEDFTIAELATCISKVIGFDGHIVFDETKPDGMPRKLLKSNVSISDSYRFKRSLREGLELTYQDFLRSAVSQVIV